MRSIPNHRPSLLAHVALAGALAFSATSLAAEDKLGNFEIQGVQQAPPAQQPNTIQSPRDPASGQATGIQSPRDAASGQATSRTQTPSSALVNNENVIVYSAKSPVAGATPSTGQGFAQDAGMEQGIRRKQSNGTAAAPNGTGNFQDGEDIILRKSDTAPTGTISGQGFAQDAGQESGIRRKQPHRHRKASNQRRMHNP